MKYFFLPDTGANLKNMVHFVWVNQEDEAEVGETAFFFWLTH